MINRCVICPITLFIKHKMQQKNFDIGSLNVALLSLDEITFGEHDFLHSRIKEHVLRSLLEVSDFLKNFNT